MSYFNILSQTMSTMWVRGISEVAELLVAIRRLQSFMLNEEFIEHNKPQNNNGADIRAIDSRDALNIKGLTAYWSTGSSDLALKNISLNVKKRQLLGIIGPVGSGKSSLLQTILGTI
ncbi:unnamed protein product [Acanthoscelides obtectus]|nr:unnamed protein product [Acanthoscelides obtectus]CAH2016514.1 unnamed protein product [Acanthoscelides obtectus]CAK1651087.1 Probable multidrug resistance-associated protein lethal(2)03659 [Acanthoscelides obtectus]CAK1651101.1 Probable multidrug resistance-associated protein lethal(2)03659 [Acanthoscelides obtectus]